MKTAHARPIRTSQKYSNELNWSANSASAGAAIISTAVPKRPPTAEKTRPAPSAVSARPLGRDEDRARQAHQDQPEVLERAELERELGERGRRDHQHRGAEEAADRGEDEAGAERRLGEAARSR